MATTEPTAKAADGRIFAGIQRGLSGAVPAGKALAGRARRKFGDWSAAETGRLALWAPVAIGAGAGAYFALKVEPPLWLGLLLIAASAALWRRAGDRWRMWASALFFLSLGFAAAECRSAVVKAPVISRELSPREVTGRLLSVEEAPDSRRLLIAVSSIDRVETASLPRRIRVTWRRKDFGVLPGDMIRLRAGLSPPGAPVAPGAYDFARAAFFERIGAVGFVVSAPQRIEGAPRPLGARIAAGVERARLTLARRIFEKAHSEGGAIVAAVVTGKRGEISERAEAALRDAGLAHLLAISGLHMGLATGLIFFSLRLGLALVEPLALRYPIKKWAAAAALLSGFCYLLLSGGGWSARRAFIMSSIIFIAILADRRALSLRNVAVAATIILLMNPEAVLHPGFQMSFAAVTALIAAYEWASSRADPNRSFSLFAKVKRYAVGLAATDTVAALATSPYSFFHFHRAALYGLAANVTSVPIMGFLVMPAAIGALILMPFGLDGFMWRVSAAGVEAILAISEKVASQPGAIATTGAWPVSALVILTLGGLWLCLQKALWRVGGLIALPVAFMLIADVTPPAIFVTDDGENAGVVIEEGEGAIALVNPRRDKFSARVWKEYAGLDAERAETRKLKDVATCDALGCAMTLKGKSVAFSENPMGLAEDCARADIVIALYPVDGSTWSDCRARLIDRRSAWMRGAHAVWIGNDGEIRIRTVNGIRGERPWSGA